MNIESLLRPVSEQSPSGSNLRYTIVYDQIKEARRSDDQLARGEWKSECKCADWQQVIQVCRHALTHKSKDLQISIWLTEALLHQKGFEGLHRGLELISGLLETFWETLYPPFLDRTVLLRRRDKPYASDIVIKTNGNGHSEN